MNKLIHCCLILLIAVSLQACIGTVIGSVVDATIEVAKIPFKVGGAVIDVATGGDDDDFTEQPKSKKQTKPNKQDKQTHQIEQQGL